MRSGAIGCGDRLLRKAVPVVLLSLLLAGCGRSEEGKSGSLANSLDAAAPAAAAEGDEADEYDADGDEAGNQAEQAPAGAEPASAEAAQAKEEEERRGRSRQARCRIGDEPEQPCTFTPVFGDGSFDIEMPDRQLRLIVDGEEAAPFEVIGQRRIPIPGLLRRDPADRACWVAQDADAGLSRVCAR